MGTKEPDKRSWRENYDNKSLSGIEVLASNGEIVNFITINHKEVLKDKLAHRTVIKLDENSKPILPPKQTFEELIRAKQRQQAILFGHSTSTTTSTTASSSTNAILSNRAARRVVAAATARAKARSRSTLPAAVGPVNATTDADPASTLPETSLTQPDDAESPIVARLSRPVKRRRWPKLTRSRRSATTKKRRDRERARKARQAAEEELEEEHNEEKGDEDDEAESDQDQAQGSPSGCDDAKSPDEQAATPSLPINEASTSKADKDSSPLTDKEEEQESANNLNDDNNEAASTNSENSIKNEGPTTRATPTPTSVRSKSPAKGKNPKRRRPGLSKSRKKKKPNTDSGAGDKKVVTSIKALCKQNPLLTEIDPKEVKLLLKTAEPGS